MTGGSIFGYSLTSRLKNPTIPNSTRIIERTIDNTGLLIQTDDKLILIIYFLFLCMLNLFVITAFSRVVIQSSNLTYIEAFNLYLQVLLSNSVSDVIYSLRSLYHLYSDWMLSVLPFQCVFPFQHPLKLPFRPDK